MNASALCLVSCPRSSIVIARQGAEPPQHGLALGRQAVGHQLPPSALPSGSGAGLVATRIRALTAAG